METFRLTLPAVIFTQVTAENLEAAQAVAKRLVHDCVNGPVHDGWPVPIGTEGRCFVTSIHPEEILAEPD